MHLSLNAVACAMRTKNSGVQGRRARSARYAGCAKVVCFDLASGAFLHGPVGEGRSLIPLLKEGNFLS